jgi:Na+/H+ antiporter NhaD/arsenite permease-like protein
MAIGQVPGTKLDRNGAALLGAIACIISGGIAPEAAWEAVDFATIALLYGLMMIASQLGESGLYDLVGRRTASLKAAPAFILLLVVLVSGVFSAVLSNLVVVIALVPLVLGVTLSRGLNPTPFLLGLVFGSNTLPAGVVTGTPQNLIASQALNLSYTGFMKAALPPAAVAMLLCWAVLAYMYRDKWQVPAQILRKAAIAETPFDTAAAVKAGATVVAIVAAFLLTEWPRDIVVLTGAAFMLLSRKTSSETLMKGVDGNLILLVGALFVVNAAFANTGLPTRWFADLAAAGINIREPQLLYWVMAVLSDLVGNIPATMLALPHLDHGEPMATGAALALGSSFASNVLISGSLAGIFVIQIAAEKGHRISLAEFTRAGLPATALSLIVGAAWIWWVH